MILVEPVYRGNVGSVSRIMHNFAFHNLRIVGGIPEKEDFVMGMHSEEIMEKAEVFTTLGEAIQDMDRVIALSRRHGSKKRVDMNPRELGRYISELEIQNSELIKIGLVFGRETFGLTDEEAEICDMRCHIPANEKFPSLNLAQAVGVILYEVFVRELGDRKQEEYADRGSIVEAVEYAMGVCEDIKFFKDDKDKKYISDYFYSLLYRGNATKQMTIDLKKVFNRVYLCFFGRGKGY